MTMPEFLQKAGVILGMAEKNMPDSTESESLKLQIQHLNKKIGGLELEISELDKSRAALATENTELKSVAEKAKADFNAAESKWKADLETAQKSAGQKAAEIAASQGIPAAEVPAAESKTEGDLLAQYAAITDPAERTAFITKNETQIKALLAKTR